MKNSIPFLIGILVASVLYFLIGWWGFLVIFPWIGFAISLGMYLQSRMPPKKKSIGRRITILMILPCLLFFVPVANNENFQLEGIVLLILTGYFSKGFIHYAIAKIFGPLIWGRGFCGWACWTAAVLDWLPVGTSGKVPPRMKRVRYLTFLLSILLPVSLVIFLNYDVRAEYLNKTEMFWMFSSNIVYYLIAIWMAFYLNDRRAFCKIACPVAVVMEVPTSVCLITISPSGKKCVKCSRCNNACPMDVDVMSFISQGKRVRSTECILCMECKHACPSRAIK
ncbi:MAG: 4Fe-4S binding protein [Bacillota bacterium]